VKYAKDRKKVGLDYYRMGSKLCKRGMHPLSGDNLVPSELKRGKRACRACWNKRQMERYYERKQAAV